MPRTAARVTQADIARAARVARQMGGLTVEVAPDGTIRLVPSEKQDFGQNIVKPKFEDKPFLLMA